MSEYSKPKAKSAKSFNKYEDEEYEKDQPEPIYRSIN